MTTTRQISIEARQRWLGVLSKASLKDLEAAWQRLGDKPRYRLLRPSETGLVMVRGRIGGSGQPFHFGEMTMTRAAVQLLDPGNMVSQTGFGYVAGRSGRRAELVAVFDALLQDPVRQDRIADAVIEPLAAGQAAAKAARAAKVMASKVDFFTMVRGE
jgi:alpha-D-ribose 1-methylphosphonate 5-triphosphate synthase subunit PhnG